MIKQEFVFRNPDEEGEQGPAGNGNCCGHPNVPPPPPQGEEGQDGND